MKKRNRFIIAAGFLTAFVLWTAAVRSIDVKPIGPRGTQVGFSAVNEFVHNLTGVHMSLYILTDWLGLAPFGIAAGFGMLGLYQWIRRKSFLKVDFDLLVLGAFYIMVILVYVLFEMLAVNFRPVLIDGRLEASYPSSTTMLVLCVMTTAAMQFDARIKNRLIRQMLLRLIKLFSLFMVAGRLISGVHWFSDIVGAILLSAGLVMLYCYVLDLKREQ